MTQNINFYDASLRTRREWFTLANATVVVSACVIGMTTAVVMARSAAAQLREPALQATNELEAAQNEITELTQRMSESKPNAGLETSLRLAQATMTQRQAALDLLRAGGLGNETGHADALSAFARQSISGLWLTGLTLENQQVALRGRSTNPELIPSYVNRLNKEAALKGRSFRALDISRPVETPVAAATDAAASDAAPTVAVPRPAPYVEFSLVSAHGAEAPTREKASP